MEGEYRPQPKEAAFNAGNTEQSGEIVPTEEGNNWYEQDIPPHEQLVATIRGLLAQEQEQIRADDLKKGEGHKAPLHPFWLLSTHLLMEASGTSFLNPEWEFFHDLQNAWDAISYDHYPKDSEERRQVGRRLRFYLVSELEGYKPHKSPKPPFPIILKDARQVALLDAMAEAVNLSLPFIPDHLIPDHQRGQRVIPLPSLLGKEIIDLKEI